MKILLGIEKKYIKGNFFILLIWIVSAFNYFNPDMENYKNLYLLIGEGTNVRNIEYGFCIFMLITSKLGLTYNVFIFIYFSIAILFFIKGLSFFIKDIRFVLILYIIFPFFLDVVQIRNFMSMSITIYSLHFLLKDDFKNTMYYIIGIIIASSFHSVSFSYLVFLLCKKQRKRSLFLIVIAGFVIIIKIFLSLDEFISSVYIQKMLNYMGNFLSGTQIYTKVLFVIYFLLYFGLLGCLNKETEIKNIEYKKCNLIYRISKIMFIFLPFVFFDVDFFRIYRNLIPIFNATICYQISYLKIENRIFYKSILLFIMFISFYFFIGIYTFEEVFINIIKYNYLWG